MSSGLTVPYIQRPWQGVCEASSSFVYNTGLIKRARPPVDAEGTSLSGKTIIVTGANRGIGSKIVSDIGSRGARVLLAVRDTRSGEEAVQDIINTNTRKITGTIHVLQLDLASWKSVRQFAQVIHSKEDRIDCLRNNAGICVKDKKTIDPEQVDGKEGLESMVTVNYYSTVLLTLLLYDKIKATPDSKIIFLTSLAHFNVSRVFVKDMNWPKGLNYFDAYGHTKLALLYFIKKLSKKAFQEGIRVYGVDPGVSKTGLGRDMKWYHYYTFYGPQARLFSRSVRDSSNSVICSLMANDKETYRPEYYHFSDGQKRSVSKALKNKEAIETLWLETKSLLDMQFDM